MKRPGRIPKAPHSDVAASPAIGNVKRGSASRAGRPSKDKPHLSEERLLEEALQILDEQGLEGLSMRAIAERLGVTAMSLYRYCDSHDALLRAIHDEILRAHPPRPVTSEQSWREVATELGRSLRRAFKAHPNAVLLFATRPVRSQSSAAHVDAVLGRLVEAGFDLGMAVYLLDTVSAFTIGHGLSEFGRSIAATSQSASSGNSSPPPTYAEQGLHYLDELAHNERPHDFDAEFVVGLLSILDGFANRYVKRSR